MLFGILDWNLEQKKDFTGEAGEIKIRCFLLIKSNPKPEGKGTC